MLTLDHVIVDKDKTLRDLVRAVRELQSLIATGGGGGGGSPATDVAFGTVKTDTFDANPVVYLAASVSTLLSGYYTSTQVDTALAGKSNTGHAHNGTDITAGTVGPVFLGSGTPDNTKFLRGDGAWVVLGGSTPTATDTTTGTVKTDINELDPVVYTVTTLDAYFVTVDADILALQGTAPTAGEKAALVGTDGAPSAGNPYVTDSDSRLGGGGGSDWDVEIIKSTNQDVVNSAVFQACSELVIPVLTGEVWLFELLLLYAGDNVSQDFAYQMTYPTASGWDRWVLSNNLSDSAAVVSTGLRRASAVTSNINQLGVDAALTPRTGLHDGMLRFEADGNLGFQFRQQLAAAGTRARVCAGSILRGKKLL